MSNGEAIKVELEALSDLRYQLLLFKDKMNETGSKAQNALQDEVKRLEQIQEKREQDVRRCQTALDNCLSIIDEEGRHPPCCAELNALRDAEKALQEIQSHISSFQSQAEQYLSHTMRYCQSLDGAIENCRSYLYNHITQTTNYLRAANVSIPSTPGQSAHGSEYQRARRRWYREAASGDFENEPSHLRGWMRQEVNSGRYYSSPRGYDTGHFLRNLNIPENFRWEASEMNRSRPTRALRHFPHINNF